MAAEKFIMKSASALTSPVTDELLRIISPAVQEITSIVPTSVVLFLHAQSRVSSNEKIIRYGKGNFIGEY